MSAHVGEQALVGSYSQLGMEMKRFTALVLLVIGPSMAVNAQTTPTLNPATGKSYMVVKGSGANGNITWEDAKAAAALMTDRDLNGHLATITSAEEFTFVDVLRQQALTRLVEPITQPQVWIGGSQSSSGAEPGGGWLWENLEGPIPTPQSPTAGFSDWAQNEPNNSGGNEEHLTLGRFAGDPGFNDEGSNPSSIGGYIVEFEGGTVLADTCEDTDTGDAGTEPGCNPSGVARYVIPGGASGAGDTVTAGLVRPTNPGVCPLASGSGNFAYLDPRVSFVVNGNTVKISVESNRPLDVFAELGGTAPNGDNLNITEDLLTGKVLTLDKNTYGSPCFAVVLGSTDGFEILTGTVLGTQLAEDVPGIGHVFSCNRLQGDLQKRGQFTFMTTNPAFMAEGGAAAMTSACVNPLSGTTKTKSFDVLNTHENCGLDYAAVGGPAAVRKCFDALATAKFDLLDQVLANSKVALISPKYSTLTSKVNQARSLLKLGQYQKSKTRLIEFRSLVEGGQFTYGPGIDNFEGDLLMRTNNLIFRLEELIQSQTVP